MGPAVDPTATDCGLTPAETGYTMEMLPEAANAASPSGQSPSGLDDRVIALLRSFFRSSWQFGRQPGDQFERVAHAFCSRVVKRSIAEPRPIRDIRELHTALSKKSSLPFDSAPAALLARTVLTRAGPLKVLARRTPWLMAASVVPGAYSALARGRDEVAIVASFLVNRSRQTGSDIDADRLRRVTVQLLQRRRLDPSAEPANSDLVSSWIRRAIRSALPFTKGGTTPHAKSIAAAAAAVDPSLLHPIEPHSVPGEFG